MISNVFKCGSCDLVAEHVFVGTKNGSEERFYGCQEHFMDIISTKINNEGYEFSGAEKVENAFSADSLPVIHAEPVELTPKPSRISAPPKPVLKSETHTKAETIIVEQNSVKVDVVGIDQASGREISGMGQLRGLIDAAEAEAAGFVLKRPLYSVGTKVVDTGVQNFRRSRQEFESKPKLHDGCNNLISMIEAEERRDSIVRVRDIGMLPNGRITRVVDDEFANKSVVLANAKTLGQLMVRTSLENTGSGYLEACNPILRSHNVNYWLAATDNEKEVKLRLRKVLNNQALDNEIYAVVGPNYATFDSNKIAEIVKEICSPDGRVEIMYDGFRTRITITFHSDIKPEDCVAGELFKAGIIIKTSDAGDGSIRVSAFVERNLCLNLIVIDKAVQQVVKRRHTGDQDTIAGIIQAGIQSANDKIAGFVGKWNFANKEELVKNTIDLEHKDDSKSPRFSLSHELFMAGLFNGMIERELVTVRGKREDAVDNLLMAWNKEPAMTRAGVINAMTRYAHETEQNSPWDEDIIQEEAGSILFDNRPLPWMKVVND